MRLLNKTKKDQFIKIEIWVDFTKGDKENTAKFSSPEEYQKVYSGIQLGFLNQINNTLIYSKQEDEELEPAPNQEDQANGSKPKTFPSKIRSDPYTERELKFEYHESGGHSGGHGGGYKKKNHGGGGRNRRNGHGGGRYNNRYDDGGRDNRSRYKNDYY